MATEGRASGKVILLGEHAVVHGVPAIAVGLERGARATRTPLASGPSCLYLQGVDVPISEHDDLDLARAFRAVLDASLGAQRSAVRVNASAELPPGGGLGCSAALGVAIARALDEGANATVACERAMAWERVFHGNPSGIDTAVAAHGGFLWFRKGAGIEELGERARGLTLDLCIGLSGAASSTKTMVEMVARLRERRSELVEKAFAGIDSLVKNARLAILAGDRVALGRLMDLNQMVLAGLYLSTPELEDLCARARAAGALGAKLTGAGGGGCVVALVQNRAAAARVLASWREGGFDGFSVRAGGAPLATAEELGL